MLNRSSIFAAVLMAVLTGTALLAASNAVSNTVGIHPCQIVTEKSCRPGPKVMRQVSPQQPPVQRRR